VPSIFIWKNAPSAAQIARKDRANRQKGQPVKRLRMTTHSSAEFVGDIDMEVAGVECELQASSSEQAGLDCVEFGVQNCTVEKTENSRDEAGFSESVLQEDENDSTESVVGEDENCDVEREESGDGSLKHASGKSNCQEGYIRAKQFINRPGDLHYYTSLIDYEHLKMIMNILGDCVNDLFFTRICNPKTKSFLILSLKMSYFLL